VTIKTIGQAAGDGPGTALVQSGVRADRVTLEVFDGDTAKIHLDVLAALELASALVSYVSTKHITDHAKRG
jgi:hypothetical protein